MPNWTENILILEGSTSELEKFYTENKDKDNYLVFNKSVKRPQEQEENWYEWNNKNWGTKWDTRDCIFHKEKYLEEDNFINACLVLNRKLPIQVSTKNNILRELFTGYRYHYSFLTAWSPPFSWLEKVALKYKNIKFNIEYSVEGFDDGGNIIIQNDTILKQEKWNVSEKIYSENKNHIHQLINEYLSENQINIINNLTEEEKNSLYCDLSYILNDYEYYIGYDQIFNYLENKN